MVIEFTLVVLRCQRLDASKRFYEALGINFIQEQHEEGPIHWSALVGSILFELYPATRPSVPTRLGFRVDSNIEELIRSVRSSGEGYQDPHDPHVIIDPDGNKVELDHVTG